LEDSQASKIADEYHCRIYDIYGKILSMGIYPYRYLRNKEAISIQEQLKLAKSRVTVVGAGGLGGHVTLLLARLGIGQLGIVDHDIFDETNLNRQALCRGESLGRHKAEEAAIIVGSINPGILVTSYPVRIDSSNAEEILTGSDVVVDGLDNVPDRLALETVTKKLGIPLIHGALAGFGGQVMTIFPEDPGLNFLYGRKNPSGDKATNAEAILGVPALMPSLIATFQAMEALKIILKRGRVFRHRIVHLDLEFGEMSEFHLS
jgi:molybdopterin/thiamine biosynthesis adenylyltransferase